MGVCYSSFERGCGRGYRLKFYRWGVKVFCTRYSLPSMTKGRLGLCIYSLKQRDLPRVTQVVSELGTEP